MSNTPPRRPNATTVLIGLTALGVVKALWSIAFDRATFEAAYPGITPMLWIAYGVLIVAIVVTLAGLWRMQRWSVLLLVVTGMAGVTIDLLALAPIAHVLATCLSTSALFASLWPARHWFLRGESGSSHPTT